MFTGIVAALGRVAALTPCAGGARIDIEAKGIDLAAVSEGDSIAVNGVCLTALRPQAGGFGAELSAETLRLSCGFELGALVNLELALRFGDRLDGHLVLGHVDGVGQVRELEADGDNCRLRVALPRELARYCARKGSITVHGVSLTINRVDHESFEVNLIPHTRAVTNLGALRVGDQVNLEVDPIARYLERLLAARDGT